MRATQAHLKAEGSQHFGVIGFCKGGIMAPKLAAEPDLKLEAFVAAHPAGIPVVSAIHPSSKQVRFDDAHHGFLAARADFKNELLAKRANEGIREMHDFFVAHLGKSA
ncbi:hypothetical protein BJ741DRAFT_659846 [Chytriomyces cf. hyalinus JEL632]|nr:hypothetical protein BJ741DRAFT_659846 [Chytriomyces cf. hyalinus JEL632]